MFSVHTPILLATALDSTSKAFFVVCIISFGVALCCLCIICIHRRVSRQEEDRDQIIREAKALGVVAGLEKADREKHALEMAILEFCASKIAEQLSNDPLPHRYRWELRKKFCDQFLRVLASRHNPCIIPELSRTQKDEVIAEHPLLSEIQEQNLDSAKAYSEELWYKDIQSKVSRFASSIYSDTGSSHG